MNSSGIWLRDRTKQLPTPVVLPDTFIEHKKTLLNSPNEIAISGTSNKMVGNVTLLGGELTTISNNNSGYCDSFNDTKVNTSSASSLLSNLNNNNNDSLYQSNGVLSTSQYLLNNSRSNILHSNQFNNNTNSYSITSLNTPVTLRAIPYKRYRRLSQSKPTNLSKNDLDTSYYDSTKNLRYMEQSFNVHYLIDKGAFSEVFHVQSKTDKKYYAIKMVNLVRKHNIMFKYNEVHVLDKMKSHINIIHFYSAWREFDYMFLKTELCLDNFSKILIIKKIDENELLIFLAHTLKALEHIHSYNIIHLDIKCSNILLGVDGYYKVADFGLASTLPPNEVNYGITEGDSRYMAAELLQNNVSTSVDIFSLGMSLVEAIFNINLPVDGELWHQLRHGNLPVNDMEALEYSSQLIDCVKRMIAFNPNLRPTPSQLFRWSKLSKAIYFKSSYLTLLLQSYENNLSYLTSLSDSSDITNANKYLNTSTTQNALFCSTPLFFIPPVKKSRPNSPNKNIIPSSCSPLISNKISGLSQEIDDNDDDSDIIELNFSD